MRIELSFFTTTQPCPTSRTHSIYSYFPDPILPVCLCVTVLSQVFDVYMVMVVYDISYDAFFIQGFVSLEADNVCHPCWCWYYYYLHSSWHNFSSPKPAHHWCKSCQTRIFCQYPLLGKSSLSLPTCSSLDWWLAWWLPAVVLGSPFTTVLGVLPCLSHCVPVSWVLCVPVDFTPCFVEHIF